jgi:hypothetical protein
MENYVWDKSPITIYSVLVYCKKIRQRCLIWQLDEGNKRVVADAIIDGIDPTLGFLYLKSSKNLNEIFCQSKPIFVRFENRQLLFNTKILELTGSKLNLKVPKEFKVIENRTNGRKSVEDGAMKATVEKADSEIIGRTLFNLNVIDVSETGMALKYSISQNDSFREDDKIIIKKIGVRRLKDPITCRIVHLTELGGSKDNKMTNRNYKMGIHFEGGPNLEIKEMMEL